MNEAKFCADHDWETIADEPDVAFIGYQRCKNCGIERGIPDGYYDDPDLDY